MIKDILVPIAVVLALVICCCIIVALGIIMVGLLEVDQYLPPHFSPIPDLYTATPFELTRIPFIPGSSFTLLTLDQTVIPQRDLAELACRFDGICGVPETIIHPEAPYHTGAERQFWISNSDTGEYSQITASLEYLTPHAYFWVENGVRFDYDEASQLIDTFEDQIYPTNRSFFGSEWSPGVDNDPHIFIIYARDLGAYVAGYFISLDEYNPIIIEHSNAIEAFYIDASQDLASPYTYGTLAHEFQHMIHWYQDANESSFLDEGFSELATFLNDYDTGGFDRDYVSDPDIPLTDWQESGENSAHYGANFLFVTYFLDRFGEAATQALVHDQQNELESLDNVFQLLEIRDTLTHELITADDFFLDWVITNYLLDSTVLDGRYSYNIYPAAPKAFDTDLIATCPLSETTRKVNQYGVDYIRISCPGDYILSFTGETMIPVLPEDPHSGRFAMWSNKANESNTSLSREFDFSSVSGPLTLEYWIWFDLEQDFDYVYVQASIDGTNWEILETPSASLENPTGSSYGWGYTGNSTGWIKETIDLSRFSGKNVTIRFDYVTDAAIVNNGFMVDDIGILETGYYENFETGEGGWTALGFARIENSLPQTYQLALLYENGSETRVEKLAIDDDQTIDIPIQLGSGEHVVLVVTATTRYTIEAASYQIQIR